jgi:hypothetical protein
MEYLSKGYSRKFIIEFYDAFFVKFVAALENWVQ